MKRAITLSAAVAAIALLCPNVIQAQSTPGTDPQNPPIDQAQPQNPPGTPANQAQPLNTPSDQSGQAEAQEMVSARVALKENLDAMKLKAGDPVKTTLSNNVSLKSGPELPRGTEILGVIAQDDMQVNGKSKLALNFTQAKLKDGTVVPIKATIVGVYPPASEDSSGRVIAPGDQVRGTFSLHQDGVDQMDALPGVDLHSKVESNVSGVLVSTKHNVKIAWGSEIALAVIPQTVAPQTSTNTN
jgi:hypothetical protein